MDGSWKRSASAQFDALLYAASALFAASTTASELVPIRLWGHMTWPLYALGAVGAVGIAAMSRVLAGSTIDLLRGCLAVLLLGGVALLPLGVVVQLRAERGPQFAQSEVLVVEAAARMVLHGHNPYGLALQDDSLRVRGQAVQEYFPYFPLMTVFGVPRAIWPGITFTDARVVFGFASLACTAVAVSLSRVSSADKLRLAQVSLVLPTGALCLVVSGNDLLVLSLMMLSLVTLKHNRALGHAVLGIGALLKATAWPLFLVVLTLPPPGDGSRVWRRLVTYGGAPLLLIVPAILWQPQHFLENTVLFPLGLGQLPSPARLPTAGSVLMSTIIGHSPGRLTRIAVTAGLFALAVCVGLRQLVAHRESSPSSAAHTTATLMTVFLVITPVSRPGYWVYPLDLLVWASLLARSSVLHHADPETSALLGRLAESS